MELETLLRDHRVFHDDTQMDFILGGRSQWGRYKQALRELYKRVRGLRQTIIDRDLLLVDLEERLDMPAENPYDKRRNEIKVREMRGRLEEAERVIEDTKREALRFYAEAVKLKKHFGDVSEEDRAQLDKEEWKHWLCMRGALDKLMRHSGFSEVLLKNIAALPPVDQQQVRRVIKAPAETLFAFYENECAPTERPQLPENSVNVLLEQG